ncbi:glycoside hydrolase [Mucilaginibacter pallidiroseus]|uniref:Glycoside hydrolase n=1 Tax=Mucilaginibacter pallidiroseus TaxID=2599295 RepID=A0A563U525_9SPHI|nr:glycoside hydrolase [Mucilaginibacter pallidiroseus]TWR26437.1 glycoside hydrolase [Mucilaginibacter pallidiroseus]
MKRRFFTTALLVCCVVFAMAAVFADLNGKWSGVINTPDGQALDVSYDFKVDGEKLTGVAKSPMGDVAVENGKIKGDDFSFTVNVSGTDYPHKGKVYADSCGVDLDFGGASTHFTLKRAK